ncbi:hypothetical protein K493DRAFT_348774 [Basidiobolus meristosporus CBS 931.73]|uniref:Secreted protein n=1 Tax=Basidiobolus meristosporus CBS 931.73 TaxID=1314790 RepID=A0A1Y1YM52_9FUNG|nr:hypothetical protein K493DRAFT_348774 [Basidiobolus meristosporus CBS 931.73]|eukprot:ORX99090.1 hypothetical protein K493DRAFT_348774 [Basidiobolus meristosporus CBS 931.73]
MQLTPALLIAIAMSLVHGQTDFPFERNGECIDKCSLATGTKLIDGFTVDPTSPDFMKSLDVFCDKTGPHYNAYMNEAMECMGKFPKDQLDGFMKNFRPICNWYGEKVGKDTTTNALNKPKSTSSPSATGSSPSSTPTADNNQTKPNSSASLQATTLLSLASIFLAAVAQL